MIKLIFTLLIITQTVSAYEITIGAKKFTEGNITAYLIAQKIKQLYPNQKVKVLENLGGTGIVTAAVQSGEIDLYVDYTGTLLQTFKTNTRDLDKVLIENNVHNLFKLGFNNANALGVRMDSKLRKISDINDTHRFGVDHEFYKRTDGFPNLIRHYQIKTIPKVIDYSLLQHALINNKLDVIEIYTTDAKIKKYNLRVLEDDKRFFPKYEAVLLANSDFYKKNKEMLLNIKKSLENKVTTEDATTLNFLVDVKGLTYSKAAATYTGHEEYIESNTHNSILPHFIEHIEYLVVTVLLCILIGVPLGVLATKSLSSERVILSIISIFQTIPSLALLVFLIPLFGLGKVTTIFALCFYGLLPIVKNTHTGIKQISKELLEYSELISMRPLQKIWLVELPLAKHLIISGVKLTSIYTIGITVIAAFVGAGGLGTLIVTGLSLNDTNLILQGAVPSALLALLVEFIFQKIIPLFVTRRS
jgi:osmoprotectant transport system permease protein